MSKFNTTISKIMNESLDIVDMVEYMTFDNALEARDKLNKDYDDSIEMLKSVSGEESVNGGLTPDNIKSKPEWQKAYRDMQAKSNTFRKFNKKFIKVFKSEYKEYMGGRN